MNSATRRLRRAGVAGLATVATVGGLIISSGTAFAAANDASNLTAASQPTIYAGTNGQAAGNLTFDITNWQPGDTIKLDLSAPGADCTTTNSTIGFAATPTLSASSTVTSPTAAPTFTTAVQTAASEPGCSALGVKLELLITFTNNSATSSPSAYTVKISGISYNVGSAVTAGDVTVTGTGGTLTNDSNAVVSTSKSAVDSVATAAASGSAQTVTLPKITLTEVQPGSVAPAGATSTIDVNLTGGAGASFTSGDKPTVTAPTNYTVTANATAGGATYSFTIAAPTPAASNATFTITGLKVSVPAGNTGLVTVTVDRFVSAGPPVVVAAIGASMNAVSVVGLDRLGGADRFATAAQIFTAGNFTGGTAHAAVIASGAAFPDALSAAYLAGTIGTRTLLTNPNSIPQATRQALITAGITTVYIVGGPAAVSTAVEDALKGMHVGNNPNSAFLNVIRVFGADRYATNNQVDLYNGAFAASNTAIVATGEGFADALAVGPAVAGEGFPLVLTTSGSLSDSAKSTLVNLGITTVLIAGGDKAVSANVETQIKALGITIGYRFAGTDRTDTAQMVATWENNGAAALPKTDTYAALDGLSWGSHQVFLARGDGFADALAAGPLAGEFTEPILLTQDPSHLGGGATAFLNTAGPGIDSIVALGLTGAVSPAVLTAAAVAIAG